MREDEIQTDEDPTTLDNTNEESEQPVSGVVLRHRLNEVDLRRTAIDFARCFLSGSAAGFSLRNNKAKESAEELSISFAQIANCEHQEISPCMNCITAMDITARRAEENLSSASRLAQAVCDSVAMESSSIFLYLTKLFREL